ncbi:sulfurtransferase, partial [Roseicyclus sp.]|uniref:sulfurtransferase n=1 Tax=Roseicyclus sp. TaxID=1914329 RepID=UPI003FA061AE
MTTTLVSPQDLAAMENVVIIDTRAPEAFAEGHIPGAVNLHEIFTFLATSDAEGIAEMTRTFAGAFGAAGLSGAETAVIYEGSMNTGFGQSCRGYFLLDFLGYPRKAVLDGGFEA